MLTSDPSFSAVASPRTSSPTWAGAFGSARLLTARADADGLAILLGAEHSAMADFILALAAFDASRGWAELGHASLFAFLQRQLRLSNGAAFHRSAAARLVQRFPSAAEALRAGRLCLSSVAELAKVLTPENEATVLPRFFGLSAREAREVVAELAPHPSPPAREVVTVVARPRLAHSLLTSEVAAPATPRDQGGSLFGLAGGPARPPPSAALACPTAVSQTTSPTRPADEAIPLTADLRRLHVTVSRLFLQKLEAAREARAHARPGATTEELLEEALDLLLAREVKHRTAGTDRSRRCRAPVEKDGNSMPLGAGAQREAAPPASSPGGQPSDGAPCCSPRARREHIPAQVRREVWARDQGRCQWPLDGGGTCGSTHRLQLDHTLAAARGGLPTAANLRILCEAHDREAARRAFGASWMERIGGGERRAAG